MCRIVDGLLHNKAKCLQMHVKFLEKIQETQHYLSPERGLKV